MSEAATCTHRMPSGNLCQSPAIKGTVLCYHHTALKDVTHQTAELKNLPYGGWQPLPFVFPEDRAALQINYFLLLQAFNTKAVDLRTFNALHRLLRSMAANLGKTLLTREPAAESVSGILSENLPSQSMRNEQEPGEPAKTTPSQADDVPANGRQGPANLPSVWSPDTRSRTRRPPTIEELAERHRLAEEIYFGGKARRH